MIVPHYKIVNIKRQRNPYNSKHFYNSAFIITLCRLYDSSTVPGDKQIRSLCGAQKYHWIITINGKMNVWKCKLIFPTDTTAKDRNN